MTENATAPEAAAPEVATETAPADGAPQAAAPDAPAFGDPVAQPEVAKTEVQATAWYEELPADIKNETVFQKYKTQEEALRGLVNAQRLIGQREIVNGLVKPQEGAPEADMVKYQNSLFRDHLGVPEKVEGYNVSEEYNKEAVQPLVNILHTANVGQDQLDKILKGLAERETTEADLIEKQFQQAATQNIATLQNEWGQSFDQNMGMANKGLDAFSEIEGLRELVTSDELKSHPQYNGIIKAFAKVGELFEETGRFSGNANAVPMTAKSYLEANFDKIMSPALDQGRAKEEYARMIQAENRQ